MLVACEWLEPGFRFVNEGPGVCTQLYPSCAAKGAQAAFDSGASEGEAVYL
jgi:hypothetical protein